MLDDAQFTEFAKFIRFFTTRVIQSVVQARLGRFVEHPCSAHPDQYDWFNTKVDELGEIAAYIRQTVTKYPPAVPSITLEFLLYTSDGQFLPLEAWQLSVDKNCDSEVNLRTELYHQLGTLLRSIISAARVTPMYRYFVRKQGEDSFVILYRIYEGSPSADLGDDSKNIRLAQLASPQGTLFVDLFFRTKMEIPHKKENQPPPNCAPPEPAHVILPPSILHNPSNEKRKIAARSSFSDAIPVAGGNTERMSPVTNHMFGYFEASPAQSEHNGDSPTLRTHFKLGRSTSSEESGNISETKAEMNSMSPAPIRELRDNERSLFGSRLRNNSFPFAALLTHSQISTKPLSSKRNSICTTPSETVEERSSDYMSGNSPKLINNKSTSPHKHQPMSSKLELGQEGQDSIFKEIKEENAVQSSDQAAFENSDNENKNNEDDLPEAMESSDESFVKVFAFASNENFGNDLGALLKEFRLAPQQLNDFAIDNTVHLANQLNEFSSYVPDFDAFVRHVSEQSD